MDKYIDHGVNIQTNCYIWKLPFIDISVLKQCGHAFHSECIYKFYKQSNLCPIWKTWISSKTDIVKTYIQYITKDKNQEIFVLCQKAKKIQDYVSKLKKQMTKLSSDALKLRS